MKHFKITYDCEVWGMSETVDLELSDSCTEEDILNIFEEGVERYGRENTRCAILPNPNDYHDEDEYNADYERAYEEWLWEIRNCSSIEEVE